MQKGFSLVELVVTVAIGTVILMAVITALLSQENSNLQLRQSLEATEIQNEVRLILNDSGACLKTVNAIAPTGMPPDNPAVPILFDEIRHADDSVAIKAPKTFANQVQVSGFEFNLVIKPPGTPVPGAAAVGGRWHYDLAINFTTPSGSPFIRPKHLEVFVEVDGNTGLIASCAGKAIREYYDCKEKLETTGGTEITVSCDDVGENYKVVSCGMLDDNPDKNDPRGLVPRHSSKAPNGCYCYDADNGGSLRCKALCCRN